MLHGKINEVVRIKLKLPTGKEIELKLKGKHSTKIIDKFSTLAKGEGETGDQLTDFMKSLMDIATEATGLSIKEIDDLDLDDKNCILNTIEEKSLSQIDFLKSSLK